MRDDDLTAKARLRDAAMAIVAEHGLEQLTARRVAGAAGVSPGLVAHHYGSMEGLQVACDRHIAAIIRRGKADAMASGPNLDPLASIRNSPDLGRILGYLAHRLAHDSPAVAQLVDDLVADAEEYMRQGEASGLLRPSSDPRGRAVVSTLFSLGVLVLNKHAQRLLGVDLTSPDVAGDPAVTNYAVPAYEVLGRGLFTDEAYERIQGQIADHA